MAEGVARLGLGGVAEEAADVGIAFDVGLPREVHVATVRLDSPANAFFRLSRLLVPSNDLA